MDNSNKLFISENCWKYEVLDTPEKFRITPNKEDRKEFPEILYKFYGLDNYSVDALLYSYLYASYPNDLNDPFDSVGTLWEIHEELITKLLENSIDPKFSRERNAQEKLKQIIFSSIGIVSMGNNINNIAMWNYYNDYKGFAIEFDTKCLQTDNSLPENDKSKRYGPFQINYLDRLQTTIITDENDIDISTLYSTNVKSEYWKQEDEFRFLAEAPEGITYKIPEDKENDLKGIERRSFYDRTCIRRVFLGYKFFTPENEFANDDKNWDNLHSHLDFIVTINTGDCLKLQLLNKLFELGVEIIYTRANYKDLKLYLDARYKITKVKGNSFTFEAIQGI